MKPELMISTQLEYTFSDAFNLTYEFRSPYSVRKLHHEMYQLKECNLRYWFTRWDNNQTATKPNSLHCKHRQKNAMHAAEPDIPLLTIPLRLFWQ